MAEYDLKILVCARCLATSPAVMRRKVGSATYPLCRPCRNLLKAMLAQNLPTEHFIPKKIQ